MHDTIIDEIVKVWVFFDPSASSEYAQQGMSRQSVNLTSSPVFPIAMNWRRRFVKFEKLIFASKRKIGDTQILSLVCSGESSNFELEFNLTTSSWKLKRVMG